MKIDPQKVSLEKRVNRGVGKAFVGKISKFINKITQR